MIVPLPSRSAATLSGALAALSILAAGCGADAPVAEAEHRLVVTVATSRRGDLQDVANASGTIVPSRVADLTIYATEHAEIAELPKKDADPVAIGDVLVRYDIPTLTQELTALQLEIVESNARLGRSTAELKRQTDLFERGISARVAYDAARLEQSAAEAAATSATMRLDALKKGDARSVVRATFPGVIMGIWHAEGDAVRPDTSDPILRVVDPTRVQVAVQLPVAQLARIVPGQTATVRAIAGDITEAATVVSKAQTVDPSAPTGEVRLGFAGAATLALDTPVSVELLLDRRTDTVIVPAAAIGRDDLGPYVMVAGDDGLAHRRTVLVGLVTPQFAQVASGLEENTTVILLGADAVADQAQIQISR